MAMGNYMGDCSSVEGQSGKSGKEIDRAEGAGLIENSDQEESVWLFSNLYDGEEEKGVPHFKGNSIDFSKFLQNHGDLKSFRV